MKSYQEVVTDRYDGIETEQQLMDNMYSFINPIGFYGDRKLREMIYRVFQFLKTQQIDFSRLLILDIGCGKGNISRLFAEITENPDTIYGLDLSSHRVKFAKEMNPKIHYAEGDFTKPLPFSLTFDLISAFNCLMHIPDEKTILETLRNIYSSLKKDGYFLWFDAYSKNHFKTSENQDHSGFNPKQMDELCNKADLVCIYHDSLFKLFFNSYHTAYLSKRIPLVTLELIERFIPAKPGNIIRIYKKR